MTSLTVLEKQRANFKIFMHEHNLNAYSWAKKAGVAEATIRHYLSGKNKSLTMVNLEKLANSMQVEVDYLLNRKEKKQDNSEFVSIKKDIFIRIFNEVDNFCKKSNLNPSPSLHANIILAWYELANMYKEKYDEEELFSLYNNVVNG